MHKNIYKIVYTRGDERLVFNNYNRSEKHAYQRRLEEDSEKIKTTIRGLRNEKSQSVKSQRGVHHSDSEGISINVLIEEKDLLPSSEHSFRTRTKLR